MVHINFFDYVVALRSQTMDRVHQGITTPLDKSFIPTTLTTQFPTPHKMEVIQNHVSRFVGESDN